MKGKKKRTGTIASWIRKAADFHNQDNVWVWKGAGRKRSYGGVEGKGRRSDRRIKSLKKRPFTGGRKFSDSVKESMLGEVRREGYSIRENNKTYKENKKSAV